ncbi:methyltransferase domain-containing protein [Candidatus Woesearchaeota archaeon]|nr:methyltransferase domain-containing protein [Candidatus Woesearchaeota archaeon]
MHPNLLHYLACPACGNTLRLVSSRREAKEITGGELSCSNHHSYPIIHGVPRMLPSLESNVHAVRKSFAEQWKLQRKFYQDINKVKTWGLEADERKALFLEQMGITPAKLKNKSVLDAGCGNGHLSIKLADYGLEVIALDITESVYLAYQYNSRKDRVFFVQGDVMHPPFKQGVFDYVYSSGVLHHTPSTKKSFLALSRCVKQGGKYWVWLYLKISRIRGTNWIYDNKPKLYLYDFIPKIVGRLPVSLKNAFCYLLIPLFMLKQEIEILTGIKQFDKTDQYRRARTSWKEKLIDLHDNFTHRYNYRHTPEEAMQWFKEAGFRDILYNYKKEGGGFGVYGIKQKS